MKYYFENLISNTTYVEVPNCKINEIMFVSSKMKMMQNKTILFQTT